MALARARWRFVRGAPAHVPAERQLAVGDALDRDEDALGANARCSRAFAGVDAAGDAPQAQRLLDERDEHQTAVPRRASSEIFR
jgi:hypothetical protein